MQVLWMEALARINQSISEGTLVHQKNDGCGIVSLSNTSAAHIWGDRMPSHSSQYLTASYVAPTMPTTQADPPDGNEMPAASKQELCSYAPACCWHIPVVQLSVSSNAFARPSLRAVFHFACIQGTVFESHMKPTIVKIIVPQLQ